MLKLIINYVIGDIFLVNGVGICLFKAATLAGNQFLVVSSAIDAEIVISERNELYLLVNDSTGTVAGSFFITV